MSFLGGLVRFFVGNVVTAIGVLTAQPWLIRVGVGISVSGVGEMLSPRAKQQQRQAQINTLTLGETSRKVGFGVFSSAGSLVDIGTYGGTNGTDTEVLAIAVVDHKVHAIQGFWINEDYVDWEPSGIYPNYPALTIQMLPGTADQVVGEDFRGALGWDETDRMTGVAGIVVGYRYSEKDGFTSRPTFLFVFEGKECYDPRKDSTVAGGSGPHRWNNPSTWEWTDNGYVCRYNWVRGIYALDRVDQPDQLLVGRGLSAIEAPPENVIGPAAICEEDVLGVGEDHVNRYAVNGVIEGDRPYLEVEEMFASAMGGYIYQPNGGVEIMPGMAQTVVREITDDDLLTGQPIQFDDFLSDRDKLNTVVTHYVCPQQKWSDITGPVKRDFDDIEADGQPFSQDLSLPLVTNANHAGRVGEIRRREGRLERRATIALGPRFCNLVEGDWIGWTSARELGGGRRVFRIETYQRDRGRRGVYKLREISADCYDVPADDPNAQDWVKVPPPPPFELTGVAVEAVEVPDDDGGSKQAARFTYDEPLDAGINRIVVRIRKAGAPSTKKAHVFPEDGDGVIVSDYGLVGPGDYEGQLEPRGTPGRGFVTGEWLPFTVGSDSPPDHRKDPPPDVILGGHGPVKFLANQDKTGADEDGTIRIVGKRINVPTLGRLTLGQKQVETPLVTGMPKGVWWLFLSQTDASARFPGWGSPTDGAVFLVAYDEATQAYTALDSSGEGFAMTLADDDVVLARVQRKHDASPGIDKIHSYIIHSKGLAPDFDIVLAAPAAETLVAEAVSGIVKDGAVRQRLHVFTSETRTDADLYVKWRPAAGPYPGAEMSADFGAGVYLIDEGAADPETTWREAKRPLNGGKPDGYFGSFDAGEDLDAGAQWRESDDVGHVSPWTLVADVPMTGDTTAPKPAAAVTAHAKGQGNQVDVTEAADQDADFFDYLYFRTEDGVVAPDSEPTEVRRAAKWLDTGGVIGTAYIYVVFTRDRSLNVDWAAGVASDPVTTRGVKPGDVDPDAPSTPTGISDPPAYSLRTTPAGTQQQIYTWTWNDNPESDIGGYAVRFRHNALDPWKSKKVKEPVFDLQVGTGEAPQIQVAAHNILHRYSAYTAPSTAYTVPGDTTVPGVVTLIAGPDPRPKGMHLKVRGNAAVNFAGIVLYYIANGSGVLVSAGFYPGSPGQVIQVVDSSAHAIDDALVYLAASVNNDMVESPTRTSLGGSVKWEGVKQLQIDASAPTVDSPPSFYIAQGKVEVREDKGAVYIGLLTVDPFVTLETKTRASGLVLQRVKASDGKAFRWGDPGPDTWSGWETDFDSLNKPHLAHGDVPDAGNLAPLNTYDVFDYVSHNLSGAGTTSLVYGVDKPSHNFKLTGGVYVYTAALSGGTNGDQFVQSNHPNSTTDLTVSATAGGGTVHPGEESCFVFQSGTTWAERIVRPLLDPISRQLKLSQIPTGRSFVNDDADHTIALMAVGPNYIYGGTITAQRDVRVQHGSGAVGFTMRITRTASGAFNIRVIDDASGNVLATMTAAKMFVDVEWNGVAVEAIGGGSWS